MAGSRHKHREIALGQDLWIVLKGSKTRRGGRGRMTRARTTVKFLCDWLTPCTSLSMQKRRDANSLLRPLRGLESPRSLWFFMNTGISKKWRNAKTDIKLLYILNVSIEQSHALAYIQIQLIMSFCSTFKSLNWMFLWMRLLCPKQPPTLIFVPIKMYWGDLDP